ncbi:MAG: ATP-binding cassette domain-containing protein [Leucobacter sp.]
MNPVFSISDLSVDLPNLDRRIVDGASLTVGRGEISALVGESGSGKSTVALAALGYAKAGARVTAGRILLDGVSVLDLSGAALREFRRDRVSYVPQDPGTALNPALRLRTQFGRALAGRGKSRAERAERAGLVSDSLRAVGLPGDAAFVHRYPQQLSGGQQQRVLIAMAIINRPNLIVWDEPTTGLDVVTKSEILGLIRDLSTRHGIAGLYISHDLSAVAEIADTVSVMQSGGLVEQGPVGTVLRRPRHNYTRRLVDAVPSLDVRAQRGAGVPPVEGVPLGAATSLGAEAQPPLLEVRDLGAAYGAATALQHVSFELRAGECTAIVGESGSGKSTLSRTLVGVGPRATGEIGFDGSDLQLRLERRTALQRREIQYVFQNPYGSFQPRRTIGGSIRLAATHAGLEHPGVRTAQALDRVGLDGGYADRYPDELSGGERQRAALARALVAGPRLLLCDEITSALDVSIQAQIVELLRQLMSEGVALMFVTHDLAVAKALAHDVVVLRRGEVIEAGSAAQVFETPRAPYTRELLQHSVSVAGALDGRGLGGVAR